MKSPLVLAACLVFLSGNPAGAAVWTAGHGDLSIGYAAGANPSFTALWRVGTGGDAGSVDGMDVYDAPYLPAELTPQAGLLPLPSPDAARTGGSLLYLLPQDGTDASFVGAPFQGWEVSGIPSGTFTGNRISLDLIGISGPGAVSLWSDGAFGDPEFKWTSADGFTAADSFGLGLGGHSHFNLGFTLPGEYTLEVLARATLTVGGSIATPIALHYRVVPETSSSALLLGMGAVLSFRRSNRTLPPSPV